MKNIKRLICLLSALCISVCLCVSVSAENNVSNISVEATLREDGSMLVEQVWTGNFDEGTECYYPFNTLDRLKITDFTVKDKNRKYETLDTWDVDADFDEKAGKCGLNPTDEGYEVCWGISNYGKNTYEISYVVENVVGAYEESDGFNFRFVNAGMNTTPTSAKVVIKTEDGTELSDKNCNIWAFGYDGDIQFEGGSVVAKTMSDLEYENHMTLMLEFDKGIFAPAYMSSDSFEIVKERAFDGSDYESDDDFLEFLVIFAVCVALFIVVLIAAAVYSAVKKIRFKKFMANCDYVRDVPDSPINTSYAWLHSLGVIKENAIIGARILRLTLNGCIEPVTDEKTGLFGNSKKKVSFRIVNRHGETNDSFDKELFDLLEASAGEDRILDPKEMKNYCNAHPNLLRGIIKNCQKVGIDYLYKNNFTKNRNYKNISKLTDVGKKELSSILGLWKYLEDFSLISEKQVTETFIWQDYLVYAMLFGIADKVIKELKEIYPESISEIEMYERNITFSDVCCAYMYSSMLRRERADEARQSGGGGMASFGGGGGFSGGGFGGGTR